MDKRTVSAIFLILLVIMAYQLLILPRFGPPPPPSPETAPEMMAPSPTPTAPTVPAPVSPAISETYEEIAAPPVGAERKDVTIKRPLYSAVLDTFRGGLRSWRLAEYSYSEKAKKAAGEPVEILFPGREPGALGLTLTDSLSGSSFSKALTLEQAGNTHTLSGMDNGLVLSRAYRFSPDSYDVEMDITFENRAESARLISWEIFVGPDLDQYRQDSGPDRPEGVSYVAGEIDKVKVKSPGESKDLGMVSWVGIGDRYFLSALATREGALGGFIRKNSDNRTEIGLRSGSVSLAPHQVVAYKLTAYFGPKEQDRLSAYNLGLEKSVNYGWFSWLALPFLAILKFFYSYLHNWGLAILALTLVVKLALFPITQGMYRSMRKMQSLQPQIQALKKKFKDDSQTLQRETMALYRQYKVNPMAGCLPMVIQIPVFFALYRVLYNAIELRGASFLYIPDLSLKDPYYVAPLLMGATMILQQKMSPTSVDPKQAKMMMFMPIIFTAMFLNFSSGLVLYFLFSNVMAIGEQSLVRRWTKSTPTLAATTVETPKKGKRKR